MKHYSGTRQWSASIKSVRAEVYSNEVWTGFGLHEDCSSGSMLGPLISHLHHVLHRFDWT